MLPGVFVFQAVKQAPFSLSHLAVHQREQDLLPSPSDRFCLLLVLRGKGENHCNQKMENKCVCKRKTTMHSPYLQLLSFAELSITRAAGQECSPHSSLNGCPNFALSEDNTQENNSAIILDFATIWFASLIGSTIKPLWIGPLFFLSASNNRQSKEMGCLWHCLEVYFV